MMGWRQTRVAPDGSHHLDSDGRPLYTARYREVLKYHAPGLAPALGEDGGMHIDLDGLPAYRARFARTFGFYEGRAAVDTGRGWHHILPDGSPSYPERYAWCGNYQGGRVTARLPEGRYAYLNLDGHRVGSSVWRYAGDYRDGVAVVQGEDGRHTHIDAMGEVLHGRWFQDLDVFHKGFARARDLRGWTHIDTAGQPLYRRRFAMVEPFYNGQARVERFDGGLEVIDEQGKPLQSLRPDAPAPPWSSGRLGRWEIGEEIHRGSHGAVYTSGGEAVIKSTSNLSAWAREVELLELLQGRVAPRLQDAFVRAGTGYLVLEHIGGASLGGRHQTRPRSVERALQIIQALLLPLTSLHDAGWAHTDLHPQNVLETDERVVLLDYANAVRTRPTGLWAGETHWGRWEFVPPEQFEGFTQLDRSADTYAACALLAYLIQGHTPFRVDVASLRPQGWGAVRAAFLATRAAPELSAIPAELRAVLQRGLSPTPEVRFSDAHALQSALEGLHG